MSSHVKQEKRIHHSTRCQYSTRHDEAANSPSQQVSTFCRLSVFSHNYKSRHRAVIDPQKRLSTTKHITRRSKVRNRLHYSKPKKLLKNDYLRPLLSHPYLLPNIASARPVQT